MVNVLILIPFLFFVVPPLVGFFWESTTRQLSQSPWNIRLTRFLPEVQGNDNLFIFVFACVLSSYFGYVCVCLHSLSLSRWSQKYSFDTISAGSWVERQLWGICCKNFYFLPNLASEGGRGGYLIPFIIIMYIKAIKNSKSFFQKYKKGRYLKNTNF